MKKTLLITALAIAVVSTMTAGALAVCAYSNQVQTAISAKTFIVSAASQERSSFSVDLAPGQSSDWTFTVANYDKAGITSISLATTLTVTVPTVLVEKGVVTTLVAEGGSIAPVSAIDDGSTTVYTYKIPQWSEAGDATSVQYTARFSWNNVPEDMQDQEASGDVVVSVCTEQTEA